jgi:hypothetical protein
MFPLNFRAQNSNGVLILPNPIDYTQCISLVDCGYGMGVLVKLIDKLHGVACFYRVLTTPLLNKVMMYQECVCSGYH